MPLVSRKILHDSILTTIGVLLTLTACAPATPSEDDEVGSTGTDSSTTGDTGTDSMTTDSTTTDTDSSTESFVPLPDQG
ncbi:MAG: hypothetical protein KC431_20200, partial [Myxococcales bacterium]|nr:hypothetical protein [Myxococcales bacterium]